MRVVCIAIIVVSLASCTSGKKKKEPKPTPTYDFKLPDDNSRRDGRERRIIGGGGDGTTEGRSVTQPLIREEGVVIGETVTGKTHTGKTHTGKTDTGKTGGKIVQPLPPPPSPPPETSPPPAPFTVIVEFRSGAEGELLPVIIFSEPHRVGNIRMWHFATPVPSAVAGDMVAAVTPLLNLKFDLRFRLDGRKCWSRQELVIKDLHEPTMVDVTCLS